VRISIYRWPFEEQNEVSSRDRSIADGKADGLDLLDGALVDRKRMAAPLEDVPPRITNSDHHPLRPITSI
jgi:hypothetical protein